MDDNEILWRRPPGNVPLDWESAHVWAVSLRVRKETTHRLTKLLTPPERRRADSFHFDRDRDRFIIGRAALRTILGRYLRAEPESVIIEYGPNGKPVLAGRFAERGLQFNLAHCEGLALLAVTLGCCVGVDLERLRAMPDGQDLAAQFCSAGERREFQSLPPRERDAAFFRIWTRKEAWLKATGLGIGQSLGDVEVSFLAKDCPRFIRLPGPGGSQTTGWDLHELTPAPRFIAALALPRPMRKVACWKYEQEHFVYEKC